MSRLRCVGSAAAAVGVLALAGAMAGAGHAGDSARSGPSAGASQTIKWRVKILLPVKVDRKRRVIRGQVREDTSDQPPSITGYHPGTCSEGSPVRIKQVRPGRPNKTVARVQPNDFGKWKFRSRRLRRKQVYAERSGYRLPNKPIFCKYARSRKVRVP